jgi:hypothetical protein
MLSDGRPRVATALSICVVLLSMTSCATGPDYKPLGTDGVGYSDQPLSPNRYRVTFSGSTAIMRDDVDHYLMRRAAVLTLASGYSHFTLGVRAMEKRVNYYPIGDAYLHGPDYARRAGLWPEYPNLPETRYVASAEIVMLSPDQAVGNPQAISAQSVL